MRDIHLDLVDGSRLIGCDRSIEAGVYISQKCSAKIEHSMVFMLQYLNIFMELSKFKYF